MSSFAEQKVANAQNLATRYVESRIEAIINSLLPDEDGNKVTDVMQKQIIGREVAKAYALGYVDGWEKQEPKKIYV